MSLETLTGKPYLSYSAIDSYLTCGERFKLERIVGLQSGDAWYLYGGSAVHEATELIDKGEETDTTVAFNKAWAKQIARIEDPGKVRAGGRATKEWPNKEDASWWTHHGPLFTQSWVDWMNARRAEGWELLEVEHGFEIELGGVPVKGYIDRVLADPQGQVHVVDLKTGSHSPPSALQLGVYSIGYHANTGIKPTIGSYFMNRKGEPTASESLTKFTNELVGAWFDMARRAIEAEVFIPHASGLCKSCQVQQHCSLFIGPNPYSPVQ